MQFVAFDPKVEVNGQTILSVVAGLGEFKDMGLKILADNGIVNPTPNKWYAQQGWLNAFKFISEKLGSFTLKQIGMKIPENAEWPPVIKTIQDALPSVDVAYHMNHKLNGKIMFDPVTGQMLEGIGHYGYEKTGDRQAKMILENPYPCDFDKGIVESVAKKFKPADSKGISVEHIESEQCRKQGQNSCTLLVKW